MSRFKVESLLAAPLFLKPQLAGDRVYFISNLSGRLSLHDDGPRGKRAGAAACRPTSRS